MIRGVLLTLAAIVPVLAPALAEACAGCSNPNLPSGRSSQFALKPGEVSATFNLTATTMKVVHSEHCPDIGPICAQRDEPAQLHDQDFYVGELRPIIEVGLTKTFGIEAQLPFRVTRATIVFRRLDGTAFAPDYENIHHRNETMMGLSDPWLSGRGAWNYGDWSLVARAGLTVPLGRTEENPFARGAAGLSHQHVQFGTGTVNPLVGFDLSRPLGSVQLNAWGQAVLSLYENGYGYQAGNRYSGGFGVDLPIAGQLRLGAGVDALNEQPERWDGEVQQDGNVGRTDFLAGLRASHPFGPLTAILSVKAPVWQQFIEAGHRHEGDPGQLTYPAVVNLAFQHTWGRP